MYEENVKRGMALLDRERPGWLWLIDLDGLNVNYCTACVLGQLAKRHKQVGRWYGDEIESLRLAAYCDVVDHGFALNEPPHALYASYQLLTATWRRLILEAREQRKLTLASQPLDAETERVLQVAN